MKRHPLAVLWLSLALLLTGQPANANEDLAPRLQIGISLLPSVIAANKSLDIGSQGSPLPIYLVYREDQRQAQKLLAKLAHIEVIRNHPVTPSTISLEALLEAEPPPLAAVFLAEPVDERFDELVEFSRARRLLLFSPFDGDVERGAAAGFRVTDKVLPMVNQAYLKQARIQLKAFFLRIAVIHE